MSQHIDKIVQNIISLLKKNSLAHLKLKRILPNQMFFFLKFEVTGGEERLENGIGNRDGE